MALESSPEWESLSVNHLEGRTAAFFGYGDAGADEMDSSGRPKKLRHPEYFDPEQEPFEDERQAFAPLVWQCRFSGVEVPDALWRHQTFGEGKPYHENQAEDLVTEAPVLAAFDAWTADFVSHVAGKGKVPPGRFRAYGHRPPPYRWDELKLAVRDVRMRLGFPRKGSSPDIQQRRGLNRDRTLRPKKSARKQQR